MGPAWNGKNNLTTRLMTKQRNDFSFRSCRECGMFEISWVGIWWTQIFVLVCVSVAEPYFSFNFSNMQTLYTQTHFVGFFFPCSSMYERNENENGNILLCIRLYRALAQPKTIQSVFACTVCLAICVNNMWLVFLPALFFFFFSHLHLAFSHNKFEFGCLLLVELVWKLEWQKQHRTTIFGFASVIV